MTQNAQNFLRFSEKRSCEFQKENLLRTIFNERLSDTGAADAVAHFEPRPSLYLELSGVAQCSERLAAVQKGCWFDSRLGLRNLSLLKA